MFLFLFLFLAIQTSSYQKVDPLFDDEEWDCTWGIQPQLEQQPELLITCSLQSSTKLA